MTRERLVQGILQSIGTVLFLPQVRPVIELLFPNRHQAVYHRLGYWWTPGLLQFEKTMKECYAPMIGEMILGSSLNPDTLNIVSDAARSAGRHFQRAHMDVMAGEMTNDRNR